MAKNRKRSSLAKKLSAKGSKPLAKQNSEPFQVDQPIICNPYEEPFGHWSRDRETGKATKEQGRRLAGYWYKTEESRTGSSQAGFFVEDREDLPLVNLLREDVSFWRDAGYPNASRITKELFEHWFRKDRKPRLFFCQREAIETIIYLNEIRIPNMLKTVGGRECSLTAHDLGKLIAGEAPSFKKPDSDFCQTLLDKSEDMREPGLIRFGCKMATGSGKTLVMAMLIAWAFCNRAHSTSRQKINFPSTVLVCCPNLTVKRRLAVLRPDQEKNYYKDFDLVPSEYLPAIHQGKVLIHNWQSLKSDTGEKGVAYRVVEKIEETPEIFARRILNDAFERMPIMVLNDEGHHCWRAKKLNSRKLNKQEKQDAKEERYQATEWVKGLDKINNAPQDSNGISFCVDLSATPFYIKGSGYSEGQPFPWLVSDFGLVDAIESGIVKIPQLPSQDTTKSNEAKYFRLWEHIKNQLQPGEYDRRSSSNPTALAAYKYAEPALQQIAGQWQERFKKYLKKTREGKDAMPPVLIIVCDNTEIAEVFYRKISGEQEELQNSSDNGSKKKKNIVYRKGTVFPDYFSNSPKHKYTIQIDSKVLDEAAGKERSKTQKQAEEDLRNTVATIGKKGEPGEHVRCVVSVAMLTEGWDANNVTQILGVRAFRSQLLCEQVVGRGLRRMNYDPGPGGLLIEEHVDVYGIPFSVIPCKGAPVNPADVEEKETYLIEALKERESMEMSFRVC